MAFFGSNRFIRWTVAVKSGKIGLQTALYHIARSCSLPFISKNIFFFKYSNSIWLWVCHFCRWRRWFERTGADVRVCCFRQSSFARWCFYLNLARCFRNFLKFSVYMETNRCRDTYNFVISSLAAVSLLIIVNFNWRKRKNWSQTKWNESTQDTTRLKQRESYRHYTRKKYKQTICCKGF